MELLRAAIKDILLKTGKHNQEECTSLADLIIKDYSQPIEQVADGPWKAITCGSKTSNEAGTEYEDWVEITDGKVTFYFDGGIDDGDENKLVALLNSLKIKLDYDHEPEHAASQYKKLYEEAYARIPKIDQSAEEYLRSNYTPPKDWEMQRDMTAHEFQHLIGLAYMAGRGSIKQGGMRWVMASERLPESCISFNVKYTDPTGWSVKSSGMFFSDEVVSFCEITYPSGGILVEQKHFDRLLWLDESVPTSNEAVEFAEWIKKEQWNQRSGLDWARYETIYSDVSIKTTAELYTLFLNREK